MGSGKLWDMAPRTMMTVTEQLGRYDGDESIQEVGYVEAGR